MNDCSRGGGTFGCVRTKMEEEGKSTDLILTYFLVILIRVLVSGFFLLSLSASLANTHAHHTHTRSDKSHTHSEIPWPYRLLYQYEVSYKFWARLTVREAVQIKGRAVSVCTVWVSRGNPEGHCSENFTRCKDKSKEFGELLTWQSFLLSLLTGWEEMRRRLSDAQMMESTSVSSEPLFWVMEVSHYVALSVLYTGTNTYYLQWQVKRRRK